MRDGAALAAVRLKTRLGEARPPAPVAADAAEYAIGSPVQRHAPQSQGPFTPAQSGGGTEPVVPTDPNQDNIFAVLANDPNW